MKCSERFWLKKQINRWPSCHLFTAKGVSELDSLGKPFWWPEADEALFSAIKAHLRDDIPVVELNCNINDPEFAEAVSNQLLTFLNQIRDHKGD